MPLDNDAISALPKPELRVRLNECRQARAAERVAQREAAKRARTAHQYAYDKVKAESQGMSIVAYLKSKAAAEAAAKAAAKTSLAERVAAQCDPERIRQHELVEQTEQAQQKKLDEQNRRNEQMAVALETRRLKILGRFQRQKALVSSLKARNAELEANVVEEQTTSARKSAFLKQTMRKLTEAQAQLCEEKQLRAVAEKKVEAITQLMNEVEARLDESESRANGSEETIKDMQQNIDKLVGEEQGPQLPEDVLPVDVLQCGEDERGPGKAASAGPGSRAAAGTTLDSPVS